VGSGYGREMVHLEGSYSCLRGRERRYVVCIRWEDVVAELNMGRRGSNKRRGIGSVSTRSYFHLFFSSQYLIALIQNI
jgi:hypothetical protein